MPLYEIELQDGSRYQVEAANEYVAEDEAILMRDRQLLAESYSAPEAALIGAGRMTSNIVEGVKQLVGMGRPETERFAAEALYEPLREASPIATAIGESMPFVAGGLAAGGGGLVAGLVRQAAMGATLGGVQEGDVQERATRAGVEGLTSAAGEAGGRLIARGLGLGIPRKAPEVVQNVANAQSLGYVPMPTTGLESNVLRNTVQGSLEATPGGAIRFDAINAQNQGLLTRHAAESIGEPADTGALTGGVLDRARQRISGEFERIFTREKLIPVDEPFLRELVRIQNESIPPNLVGVEDPVGRVMGRTWDMVEQALERGGIPGDVLQSQQSKLGKNAFSLKYRDPDLSIAYDELQDALLGLAQRNLSEADRVAVGNARSQWRNLSALRAAHTVNTETGDINVPTLASYLERRHPIEFKLGANKSPFYTGVRFLGRMQPPLRTSGTAERSFGQHLMRMGGLGAGLGFGGGVIGGDTFDPSATGIGALSAIGAGIVAPNLLARGYLRPGLQNWMTREASVPTQQLLRSLGILGAQTAAPSEASSIR